MANSPFDLANETGYRAWRDARLAAYPRSIDQMVVPLVDPRHLTPDEINALETRCARANMAIYSAPHLPAADKSLPRQLAHQLGLDSLEGNYLADEDGLSSITPAEGEASVRGEFIPYTHKPINWHTDGYYNTPERRILGMTLHCAQDAESGGENTLLDHEIAYIQLRDVNPDYVAALMRPDAMTIPARTEEVSLSPTLSPRERGRPVCSRGAAGPSVWCSTTGPRSAPVPSCRASTRGARSSTWSNRANCPRSSWPTCGGTGPAAPPRRSTSR